MYEVENGRPRNPAGRTGLVGRGLLGHWDPNHAADPILTRWKKDNKGNSYPSCFWEKHSAICSHQTEGLWRMGHPRGHGGSGRED